MHQKFQHICISLDVNFNELLTNDVVSFEQLGPDLYFLDVKKMPLGKLSKSQIAKGFDVLDDIEKELNAKRATKLNELSSKFYTVIPHDFGRKVPPPIKDLEMLRSKMDMLLV